MLQPAGDRGRAVFHRGEFPTVGTGHRRSYMVNVERWTTLAPRLRRCPATPATQSRRNAVAPPPRPPGGYHVEIVVPSDRTEHGPGLVPRRLTCGGGRSAGCPRDPVLRDRGAPPAGSEVPEVPRPAAA